MSASLGVGQVTLIRQLAQATTQKQQENQTASVLRSAISCRGCPHGRLCTQS